MVYKSTYQGFGYLALWLCRLYVHLSTIYILFICLEGQDNWYKITVFTDVLKLQDQWIITYQYDCFLLPLVRWDQSEYREKTHTCTAYHTELLYVRKCAPLAPNFPGRHPLLKSKTRKVHYNSIVLRLNYGQIYSPFHEASRSWEVSNFFTYGFKYRFKISARMDSNIFSYSLLWTVITVSIKP